MKTYCTECQQEKEEKEFYKRFTKDNISDVKYQEELIGTISTSIYGICKDCLIEKFTRTYKMFNSDFEKTLRALCEDYNLPFVVSLVSANTNVNFIERLKLYIKDISSLPQYKNMTYFIKKEKSDIDFLNEDIEKIKENLKKATFNNDPNAHGKWINSLRDALELKNKLENSNKWEEKVSKYRTDGKHMISIWEQKGQDIRNIKEYEIVNKPSITIKLDENYTIDGDTLIIPVKINGKDCNIYSKRINNEWVLPSGNTIKCN